MIREKLSQFKEWLREHKKKLFVNALLYATICALFFSQMRTVVIISESVPYKFCLQIYNLEPQKGDLCVLKYGNADFVKYVVGVAGDKVTNIHGEIYVNYIKVGEINEKSNLEPLENCIIPEGYVFVVGTHPGSLDSRYKKFGLIKREQLRGKAIGFWKCDEENE
ncbi:MAG: signal peptidase I [Holosporaceae bacterium]|jgi:signal peptidase I|nr:signal peptidase I [Holosporaceae bacterium]